MLNDSWEGAAIYSVQDEDAHAAAARSTRKIKRTLCNAHFVYLCHRDKKDIVLDDDDID